MSASEEKYSFSRALLQGIVDLVLAHKSALRPDHQNDFFCHLSALREQSLSAQLQSTISNCPSPLRWAVECCMERGASSRLSALPLEQYGFTLHKGEFIDAVCLCYGFTPSLLPSRCVCGKDFTLSHALSCPHGAFLTIQHNEVQDLTASLMTEVCHDVKVEPHLHALSGEVMHYRSAVLDDKARVDIRASDFWRCLHHRTFFDVHVLNSFAASNQSTTLTATFHRHETEKCCVYEEHIHKVEHGSFTKWGKQPLPPIKIMIWLIYSVRSLVPGIQLFKLHLA